MFKDGSRAVLYIWNGHVWEFVDEVVQSGSIMGRYFNGDDYFTAGEYDYIFDAEVADDGRKRPIPYRRVLEKFIYGKVCIWKYQFMKDGNIGRDFAHNEVEVDHDGVLHSDFFLFMHLFLYSGSVKTHS